MTFRVEKKYLSSLALEGLEDYFPKGREENSFYFVQKEGKVYTKVSNVFLKMIKLSNCSTKETNYDRIYLYKYL